MVGAALILIWWLFFSRAPWSERIGVLFVIAAAVIAIKPLVHASISNGFMGMMFYIYAVPSTVAPALVAWALLSRRLLKPARWATMVATMFLACAAWMLLRTNGITGDAGRNWPGAGPRPRKSGCSRRARPSLSLSLLHRR